MFVLDIIPLTKLKLSSPQTLTYFSSKKIERGALLAIPLRNRTISGVCLNCHTLEEKKLEVKSSRYKLSNIKEVISETPVLTEQQLKLAYWMYAHHMVALGQCIRLFIPNSYEKRKRSFELSRQDTQIKTRESKPLLIWSQDRLSKYQELVEEHTKGGQVLILVPELGRISDLRVGVNTSSQSIAYHSKLSTSSQLKNWEKARTGEAKIIVGTRSSIFLPFKNLSLIIVDEENSDSYKSWDQHPKYDTKELADTLSRITGSGLVLGSGLPSLASYQKTQTGEFVLEKDEISSQSKISVVDSSSQLEKNNLSTIKESLRRRILNVLERDEQIVLFVNRKGFATSITCRDCGYISECTNCTSPLVYHERYKNQQNIMICHHCGLEGSYPTSCPSCKGVNMKYSGIAIQKVIEDLKRMTQVSIARLDLDTAPTEEDQMKMVDEFNRGEYRIIVGTNLLLTSTVLNELKRSSLVGLVSGDSLAAYPDYHSTENALRTVFNLRKLGDEVLVQTYAKESDLWSYSDLSPLATLERVLENRKLLSYPPFTEIVRLSYAHKKDPVAKQEVNEFKEFFTQVIEKSNLSSSIDILGPAPSVISKVNNLYSYHLVLKIKDKNREIKRFLRKNLPNTWEVEIDPLSLL